jgi:hypothetical protein
MTQLTGSKAAMMDDVVAVLTTFFCAVGLCQP